MMIIITMMIMTMMATLFFTPLLQRPIGYCHFHIFCFGVVYRYKEPMFFSAFTVAPVQHENMREIRHALSLPGALPACWTNCFFIHDHVMASKAMSYRYSREIWRYHATHLKPGYDPNQKSSVFKSQRLRFSWNKGLCIKRFVTEWPISHTHKTSIIGFEVYKPRDWRMIYRITLNRRAIGSSNADTPVKS